MRSEPIKDNITATDMPNVMTIRLEDLRGTSNVDRLSSAQKSHCS
jgi:hypothetical protein